MHSQAKNEAKKLFNFSSKFFSVSQLLHQILFILARKSRASQITFVFLIEANKGNSLFCAFAKYINSHMHQARRGKFARGKFIQNQIGGKMQLIKKSDCRESESKKIVAYIF